MLSIRSSPTQCKKTCWNGSERFCNLFSFQSWATHHTWFTQKCFQTFMLKMALIRRRFLESTLILNRSYEETMTIILLKKKRYKFRPNSCIDSKSLTTFFCKIWMNSRFLKACWTTSTKSFYTDLTSKRFGITRLIELKQTHRLLHSLIGLKTAKQSSQCLQVISFWPSS